MGSLASVVLAAATTMLASALQDAPVDKSKQEWSIRKHVEVAGQPIGSEMKKLGDEAYRFVMTDGGYTSGDVVLVYKKGTDYYLRAADVSLHSFYDSKGKAGVEKTERKLTADEWNAIQAKLKALDFWQLADPEPRVVLDGTHWVLEGSDGTKYRSMSISSPEAGRYRAAGLQLWRTSGLFMGNWADKQE